MTTAPSFLEIPLIDVSARHGTPDERQALADEMCTIAHEVGFMVITGHGIDPALVAEVFALMDAFFALDEADKALIDKQQSPHFRGWEAVGSEFTNNRVDVREQIDAWSEWPELTADELADGAVIGRLYGPNQWMPESVLAGHREVTLRWMSALGSLADELLSLFATGLGLAPDFFDELFGDRPMSLTKMISYPPTPPGGAGVNAHKDTGFLTLLAPGPVAGLEVLNPAGEWISVPTVADSFVVNLGEMLQAMTGNYFVATPHRVIAPAARRSTGYFHGPSLETDLSPIELDRRFADAVAASPRHAAAGFMASRDETTAGVGDMASGHHATTYGEQLWNYFARSYPANMDRHHADVSQTTSDASGPQG